MNFTAIKYGVTVLPESWVFKDGNADVKLPISLLFFLVRSEDKKILIDVGCDVMGGFITPKFKLPTDALAELGIAPEEITDIFLSHSHSDHIDSVIHFPNAKVYINKNEAQNAINLVKDSSRVTAFDSEYSMMLDDGEIRARWIGGHSPGSSIFYLTSGEHKYVLLGDEFYSMRCLIENRQGCPSNPKANRALLDELQDTDYTPIIFHDPDLVPGELGYKQIF